MAGEVVASTKKVTEWAWQGASELQKYIEKHGGRQTQVLADATQEAHILGSLHRRALVTASETFTLTALEADVLGAIAHRSFFEEWAADFEDEYGVAK